jgi:hypothetical protein
MARKPKEVISEQKTLKALKCKVIVSEGRLYFCSLLWIMKVGFSETVISDSSWFSVGSATMELQPSVCDQTKVCLVTPAEN